MTVMLTSVEVRNLEKDHETRPSFRSDRVGSGSGQVLAQARGWRDHSLAIEIEIMNIFCPKCGQQNPANNFRCRACGFTLHDPQPPMPTGDDGTLGGLIPYKNSQALISYYCGVFSLIPCVGIPLGIVALILGIRGLKYADLHSQAKGKAHAWTGIILGGLCALANILVIVVPIVMAMTMKPR